jgi:hypothetical protein
MPNLEDARSELWVEESVRGRPTDEPVLPARPVGLALIAAWHLVSAVGLLVSGLVGFGAATQIWPRELAGGLGGAYLVGVLVNLVLGAGLWELARWARYLAIATSLLAIVLTLLDHTRSALDLALALISAAIIYYLLRPSTRALFERPSA